jgi:hypothetical protein
MSNIKVKATLASIVLVAALLVLSAGYQGGMVSELQAAQGQPCILRTLQGNYGNWFQFLNLPPGSPLPPPQPIGDGTHYAGAGIGVTTFDGQGSFSGWTQVSLGGFIPPRAAVWGTYTIDPDCTGSQVINYAGMPPATLDFVIVDNGKEVHTLAKVQGDIAFGTLKKQ